MRLDEIDQKIIIALEEDGRRPYRDIARELGVAEATVRARVGKLIDGRLIRITAVGDPLTLGVEVAAIILVRTKPGFVRQTAEALVGFPNVRFIGTSFGAADVIIQTLHPDIHDLHAFISEALPKAAPDIISTETYQLADVLKSSWDWREWFGAQAGAPARSDAAKPDTVKPDTVKSGASKSGAVKPENEVVLHAVKAK